VTSLSLPKRTHLPLLRRPQPASSPEKPEASHVVRISCKVELYTVSREGRGAGGWIAVDLVRERVLLPTSVFARSLNPRPPFKCQLTAERSSRRYYDHLDAIDLVLRARRTSPAKRAKFALNLPYIPVTVSVPHSWGVRYQFRAPRC